jgi:DNA-binding transcriptional MerR regulator
MDGGEALVSKTDPDQSLYRVGTAGQLSGVPPATIRAWERRYGAVKPKRSETGRRLYDEEDVARLQLMKALTDVGDPISAIASLDYTELRDRLDRHAARPQPIDGDGSGATRVALLDPEIEEQIRANPSDFAPLEVAGADGSIESFTERLPSMQADVLVMHMDRLGPDPVTAVDNALRAAGAQVAVVLYSFAPAPTLRRLADRGVRLLMMPARVSSLRRTIRDFIDIRRATAVRDALVAIEARAPEDYEPAPAARRFTDAQLARLQEISSSVECECPSNLSAVIKSLVAFERYSRQCVSDSPRDADLHKSLERGTGHARALMEELLMRVCEHDGLSI